MNEDNLYDPVESLYAFHRAFGLPLDTTFHVTDDVSHEKSFEDLAKLRARLILEEAKELSEAVEIASYDPTVDNKAEIIKEVCDVLYTVIGLMVSFDVDWREAFERVHASNMSKLDDDGNPVYREDGKVIKGPNYKPCDLRDLV